MPHMAAGQILTAAQYNSDAHQGIKLLQEITVATATQSVSFNDIDQSFRNLWITATGGTDSGGNNHVVIQFNGDDSSDAYMNWVIGHRADGTTASLHQNDTSEASFGQWGGSGILQSGTYFVANGYATTNQHKMAFGTFAGVNSDVAGDVMVGQFVDVWHSNAAITDIELTALGGDFLVGCNFQLYGLGDTS